MCTGRSLTVCWGGGAPSRGSPSRGCLLLRGVPPSRGGAPFLGEGASFLGGGGVVSRHALRQTPPVNRMTDRCKNITLATTSLRPVINEWFSILLTVLVQGLVGVSTQLTLRLRRALVWDISFYHLASVCSHLVKYWRGSYFRCRIAASKGEGWKLRYRHICTSGQVG